MNFLICVGMGKWMDSKNEIKIGDIVCYIRNKSIVRSLYDEQRPVKVVDIVKKQGILCVVYDDGGFDYHNRVEKCLPLIQELE